MQNRNTISFSWYFYSHVLFLNNMSIIIKDFDRHWTGASIEVVSRSKHIEWYWMQQPAISTSHSHRSLRMILYGMLLFCIQHKVSYYYYKVWHKFSSHTSHSCIIMNWICIVILNMLYKIFYVRFVSFRNAHRKKLSGVWGNYQYLKSKPWVKYSAALEVHTNNYRV